MATSGEATEAKLGDALPWSTGESRCADTGIYMELGFLDQVILNSVFFVVVICLNTFEFVEPPSVLRKCRIAGEGLKFLEQCELK